MHERPHFTGPVISWKAQKDQVNITFTLTFWVKKAVFPITERLKTRTFQYPKNKNFSVASKYHISINLLHQKDRIFHPRKVQNKNISVISKYYLSTICLKKNRISHSKKVQNNNFSVINKYHIFINFLAQKIPYFPSPKNSKKGSWATSKRCFMLKKIFYRFFYFRAEI